MLDVLSGLQVRGLTYMLKYTAHKISQRSEDERETVFLFQRISVLLQRFNSILLHDSFVREDCLE